VKIAYWVFCASKHSQILTLGEKLQTSTEYEYEHYSGLENHANTNTNMFGFEKSSEYEYK